MRSARVALHTSPLISIRKRKGGFFGPEKNGKLWLKGGVDLPGGLFGGVLEDWNWGSTPWPPVASAAHLDLWQELVAASRLNF